jgi:hypothetical protein
MEGIASLKLVNIIGQIGLKSTTAATCGQPIMLEICVFILKTRILVGGLCKVLMHGGTEDIRCERSSWGLFFITGAIP